MTPFNFFICVMPIISVTIATSVCVTQCVSTPATTAEMVPPKPEEPTIGTIEHIMKWPDGTERRVYQADRHGDMVWMEVFTMPNGDIVYWTSKGCAVAPGKKN